jgi:hypothetical protein
MFWITILAVCALVLVVRAVMLRYCSGMMSGSSVALAVTEPDLPVRTTRPDESDRRRAA